MRRSLKVITALCMNLAVAAAGVSASASQDEGPQPAVIAIAAEIGGDLAKTRLTFTLSRAVTPRAFVLEAPNRVVLELPEANFQLPPPLDKGRQPQGLIASFRYGLFAPGRSRVVIDLVQPALVSDIQTSPGPTEGTTLLTVELTGASRDAFREAALSEARGSPPAPERAANAAPPGDRRPLIVIDAGHGGIDPGAIAPSGAFEKDIVLEFVQRLSQRLESSGRYRVELTRDRDIFVPLGERVRLARAAQADLFLSVHADSITAAPSVHGGTVYTGSERATDEESASLADRENKADAAAGLDFHDPASDVTDILQDLTLRETRTFSHRFAKKLLGQLAPITKMSVKPHREAGFKVLRSPDVPSVLVELGYLSNKTDLGQLLSSEWRDRATAAIASALDQYFGPRATRSTAQSAAAPAPVSP
jgi:N-acetylmuramoyl-L-alanine amidase